MPQTKKPHITNVDRINAYLASQYGVLKQNAGNFMDSVPLEDTSSSRYYMNKMNLGQPPQHGLYAAEVPGSGRGPASAPVSPWVGQNYVMQNQELIPTRAPASSQGIPTDMAPMNTSSSVPMKTSGGSPVQASPWANMAGDPDLERLKKLQEEAIANQQNLLSAHQMN